MKQTLLFAALGVAAFGAAAQEVGNVISTQAVIQQVAVPRQTCNPVSMPVQGPTTGTGTVLGALAGAGVGNMIGGGTGHAAAIIAGTMAGAVIGNNVESNSNRGYATVPNCVTETTYENRTVAYNVTYEYAGRQYTVQMPYDPGPTIRLQVSPMVANAPGNVVTAPPVQGVITSQPAPVVVQQAPTAVVYQPYPVYPAYPAYPYPVYRPFPIGISLGFGFHSHGHRRWR
jgi:uncharacterized protein YcfJ